MPKINGTTDDTKETDSLTESEPELTIDDQAESIPSQPDNLRPLATENREQPIASQDSDVRRLPTENKQSHAKKNEDLAEKDQQIVRQQHSILQLKQPRQTQQERERTFERTLVTKYNAVLAQKDQQIWEQGEHINSLKKEITKKEKIQKEMVMLLEHQAVMLLAAGRTTSRIVGQLKASSVEQHHRLAMSASPARAIAGNGAITSQHPGPIAGKDVNLANTTSPRFFNEEIDRHHPEPLSSTPGTKSEVFWKAARQPDNIPLVELHTAAIKCKEPNVIAMFCSMEQSSTTRLDFILRSLGTSREQLHRTSIDEMKAKLGQENYDLTLNQLLHRRVNFGEGENGSHHPALTQSNHSRLDTDGKRREPIEEIPAAGIKRRKQHEPTPVDAPVTAQTRNGTQANPADNTDEVESDAHVCTATNSVGP